MRRTQIYLDEDLWRALHARARRQQTTISALVRRAVRERYLANLDQRREAMQAFAGSGKVRWKFEDSQTYIRGLRRGSRIQRLNKA